MLSVAGGFRLDDPAGEVGLEMILVRDSGQGNPVLYHVPLSYRGAELAGAEDYLLGTSEHGVLGTRWIYDAAGDPVWQRQMRALIAGEVPAQHQNDSNALDATVAVVLAPQADGPGDVQMPTCGARCRNRRLRSSAVRKRADRAPGERVHGSTRRGPMPRATPLQVPSSNFPRRGGTAGFAFRVGAAVGVPAARRVNAQAGSRIDPEIRRCSEPRGVLD